jgi:hypothetical protein
MKKDDHQKGHSRKNTANIGGAAYAPQQDEPHSKGDERTPNKPIGEVAYAKRDPTKKKTGSLDVVQDFKLALATYQSACERWPKAATLRQGARVIEDSRRLRLDSRLVHCVSPRLLDGLGRDPQPCADGRDCRGHYRRCLAL